jgi:hypothetical protein
MTDQPSQRRPWQFQPGNPGGPGRPKKVLTAEEIMDNQIKKDLKAVAKQHSPEAFRFLLQTMRNEEASIKNRMEAATQILDRGWGKPTNHTSVSVDVYEKMSDTELIKLITGKEIEGTVLESRTISSEEQQEDNEG